MLELGLFGFLELLVFAGLLITAVAFESNLFPFVVIISFICLEFFLHGVGISFVNVVHWLLSHQIETVIYCLSYVLCGVFWSAFKWYICNKDWADIAHKIQANPEKFLGSTFADKFYCATTPNEHFPVLASKHKSELVLWMMWWWISIPITVCGDWAVRVWNKIYDLFGNMFQKITDHLFSGIKQD